MSGWDDLIKYAEKTSARIDEVASAIKIELFNGIVDDTRVDTGRLKGNWSIQNGKFTKVILNTFDKNGAKVKNRIKQRSKPDTITFFTNNLPYAIVMELKDGMVARNVARIKSIIKKEAAKK